MDFIQFFDIDRFPLSVQLIPFYGLALLIFVFFRHSDND